MSTKMTVEITSTRSIQETIKRLENIENKISNNVKLAIKDLMEVTLSTLQDYFSSNNLSNHFQEVHSELLFDGYGFRIWTNDWVIIFNEYGTGIKGQGTHPNPEGYEYNKSKKEKWVYRKNGRYFTTSGMEAKHIFYDIKQELNKYASDFLDIAIKKSLDEEDYQRFKASLKEGD